MFTLIFIVRVIAWPQYNTFWGLVMALMGGVAYAWIASTILVQQIITLKNKS
jgi:hypothetical protein